MNVKTQKCKQHPDEDAIHVNNSTNDPMCVPCVVTLRRREIEGREPGSKSYRSDVVKLYNIDSALPHGSHSARICF